MQHFNHCPLIFGILIHVLELWLVVVQLLSCVWLFATPRTIAHKVSLFMGFPRQEYWRSGHFLLRGSSWCRDQNHVCCISGRFFTTESLWKPLCLYLWLRIIKKKKKRKSRTSRVAQWIRIHLSMQGTWVWSLVQEDHTCCSTPKPMCHNCWSPHALELMLHKRSFCSEKPMHCN